LREKLVNQRSMKVLFREANERAVWQVMGNRRFAFVTVNMPTSSVMRIMRNQSASANPHKLGMEFSNAIRAGVSVLDASKTLWAKFFLRLNTRLLKSKTQGLQKLRLRWIRIYENEGKVYSGTGVNHVHMLVEIPADCSFENFQVEFRELFCKLVYPASGESTVLDIKLGRHDHPWYALKQHVSPEVASERFEFYVPRLQGAFQ
jgi:Na+-transporting NADH:ubiquinone oxidoreductase subunit NqrA